MISQLGRSCLIVTKSAISTLRKICSMRTPHASGHIFLNTSIMPEAASAMRSSRTWRSGIVAVRLARVGRVQIDDVAPSRRRNACRDASDEVAVRVDQREAASALQVLEHHILQECRFSRAGLADDVNMQKAILVLNTEESLLDPQK
jgi:hypothetical protein